MFPRWLGEREGWIPWESTIQYGLPLGAVQSTCGRSLYDWPLPDSRCLPSCCNSVTGSTDLSYRLPLVRRIIPREILTADWPRFMVQHTLMRQKGWEGASGTGGWQVLATIWQRQGGTFLYARLACNKRVRSRKDISHFDPGKEKT